jgi:ribosomal-protein-alanine N-acetyltransferase
MSSPIADHPAPTARLAFRLWRDDDFPLAWSLFGEPRVTALVGGPFDAPAVRARLAAEIDNQRAHGIQYWPIALRDGERDFVGCCGLKPRAPNVHELGFYIVPARWRQGFALEAARSAIAYAFDALGVGELFAGHHPDNDGSRHVLAALGFRYTHDELYPPTRTMHPGYALRR